MRLWPFVVAVVGLVLGGTVYILVREPSPIRARGELPRLPVVRVAAPLPPRFSGPLPTQVEGFHQALEKGPPLSYVRSRILEGDREMEEKFLSALRQTAASVHNLGELWSTYGVALGLGEPDRRKPPDEMDYLENFQDEGVPCEWLSERNEDNPLLRELFWRKLVRCRGLEAEALFAREDAPVEWALQHHGQWVRRRFTPALERAVRLILAERRLELFTQAKLSIWRLQEPVARELLAQLWLHAPEELRLEWEEFEQSLEHWQRQEEAHPWKCPPIPSRPEGVDSLTLRRCLDQWVAESWAQTARFAMSASRSPELRDTATEALATLQNFPSTAAMRAWAQEQGLLPPSAPAPADSSEDSLYLYALVAEAGNAFGVDLRENGFLPRRHDDLLVTLAWKVRPALAGVTFEQLAPPDLKQLSLGETSPHEEYTLRAYADGQLFSVKALHSYSMMDISAVLSLLNQVLEARGDPRRFAVLDTDNWTVPVVFATEPALKAADARGLWQLGDGRQMLIRAEKRNEESIRMIVGEIPF
ncbi:MAG TPA: hypothetical protein VNA24_25705 [Hyalangium sp.]|nr:hypothetical protein [Hyalangium sp.]